MQLQNVEPGTVVRSVYTIDFRNKTLEQLAAEGFALPKNTTIDPEKGLKIFNPGEGPSQDRTFIKEFEDKFYGKTSMEMTFSYVSGGGFDGYLSNSAEASNPGFKLFVVDGGNPWPYGENGPEAWLEGLQLQNGQERSVRIDIDDASDNSIGIFIDGAEQNIAPKRYVQTAFNRIHFDFKSGNEFYIKTIKVYKTEYVQSVEQPAAITDRVRGTSFEALGLPKTLRVTHTNGRTENVALPGTARTMTSRCLMLSKPFPAS